MGQRLPAWQGIYLYGDYGSGLIWGLFQDEGGAWQNALLFQTGTRSPPSAKTRRESVYFVDMQETSTDWKKGKDKSMNAPRPCTSV
jgi:hypothetical protein